ncbi:hypothetical protein [Priestia megaterium]|uniref:hypothetical protein n=1 Tax=Priestia megaterium TaxID=1404 RepID=UPI003CC5F3A2
MKLNSLSFYKIKENKYLPNEKELVAYLDCAEATEEGDLIKLEGISVNDARVNFNEYIESRGVLHFQIGDEELLKVRVVEYKNLPEYAKVYFSLLVVQPTIDYYGEVK